jgi:hypothetical protein
LTYEWEVNGLAKTLEQDISNVMGVFYLSQAWGLKGGDTPKRHFSLSKLKGEPERGFGGIN